MIAGAVALVATGVGAAAIGSYASIAATVASIGAQVTAKKPNARGTVNNVVITSDAPAPYLIGRTFYAGVERADFGYGATLKKVKNPYLAMVLEYSVAGPLEALENIYTDFAAVPRSGGAATGYYSGFLYEDHRFGVTPETALTPHWSGMPSWGGDYKLSGKAAILWNLLFDRKAKRFAAGIPALGAVWKGVKVYDPRIDSTYPGGSGSQRIDDETTWTWSENPALHALAYALGRYRNGKKVFGVGLPADGIVLAHFVELANVCDANGWTVGGVIFEPGDRWANLKDIMQAGGAEPLFIGGKLGIKVNAPKVALDTITDADLADDDAEITAMQTWRDRRNGLIPKYRSEANKWDYVQSELVTVADYVAQDGEEKVEERQFNLVQEKDQAAQLAALELVNGRELGPITIVCKPRLRRYGPGDMLTLDLPEHGLVDVDCVIIDRSIDPGRMTVSLTLVSETPGKYEYAMSQTGTAPPAPTLLSPAEKDGVASSVSGNDMDPPTALTVTPGTGSAIVGWRNPTSSNLDRVEIYAGTTSTFLAATLLEIVVASGLGASQTEAVVIAPGLSYFWVLALSDDGNASDETGPVSATIT